MNEINQERKDSPHRDYYHKYERAGFAGWFYWAVRKLRF